MKNQSLILSNAKKIAVVRTDRLGDMVLTLPLCNALKKEFPNSQICIIASQYTKDLLDNNTAIDQSFYLEDYPNGIKDIYRKNKFDAVFFPRPRFNEAFAAFSSGIPLRIGSAYRYYSFLFNHRVKDHRKTANFHEAEYNTRLLSSVLKKEISTELVPPFIEDRVLKETSDILFDYAVNIEKPFIVIHPGSGGSARDWNAVNFGILGREIFNRYMLPVIITGTAKEMANCDIVRAYSASAVNLCGQLDLKHLIALVSKAKVVVANSTGVLHIAASFGNPVLGLYPNTVHISAKRWGPYNNKSVTVSPPLNDSKNDSDNMELINTKTVLEEFDRLLKSLK